MLCEKIGIAQQRRAVLECAEFLGNFRWRDLVNEGPVADNRARSIARKLRESEVGGNPGLDCVAKVRLMARPGIVSSIADQFGANRILMNVSQRFQEIRIGIHHGRVVAVFEQVPGGLQL